MGVTAVVIVVLLGAWGVHGWTSRHVQVAALEDPDTASTVADLSALDEDCPVHLDYAQPSKPEDIAGEIDVSYVLPDGFAPAKELDPTRSYPSGVLHSDVPYVRTTSKLYFPQGRQGDDFLAMAFTVGGQPHLCAMLRWAAVRPAAGFGTPEWGDRHSPLSKGPAIPQIEDVIRTVHRSA